MEFRILGPLEVWEHGRVVALGGPKQRALLATLLLHANHVVSADRLIDELWGDQPPATADNLLQGYVSQLRRRLPIRQDGRTPRQLLVTRTPGYVLRVERSLLDLHRFEQLVEMARLAMAEGAPRGPPTPCARRWRCGADRRSATWPSRASAAARWPSWRSAASPRWRNGSRPISASAGTST
jgi:hypothetical protein